MKKLSFTFILLALVQIAWAQENKQYTERLDSIITSLVFGRPMKYVFHYDNEGRLSEMIEYSRLKEEWTDPFRSIYTYDENGRITIVTTTSMDEKRGNAPYRERAEYDDKGRLSLWVYEMYSKDEDKWYETSHSTTRKYEYNAQGNRTSITDYFIRIIDDKQRNRRRFEMEYDKGGRLIIQREYENDYHNSIEGKECLRHTYHYSYDKQGNLIETQRYDGESGDKKTKPDQTIRKTYDKQGRVTTITTDLGGEFGSRDEYYYDPRGNLIQIATFRLSDGEWEHRQNMTFTYDTDTPVSSVMGLSRPEVLCNDYALKNHFNLTCKPISASIYEVGTPHYNTRYHDEATYYYSPIEKPVLTQALSQMDSVKRYNYLVKLSSEVVKNFGSGYYREYKKPEISELRVFSDSSYQRPEFMRNIGRKYYTVTFPSNTLEEQLEWRSYAAKVDVWDDDGEPKGVMFGHGLGYGFELRPYRDWLKIGIKDDEIMPYKSYIFKPEKIGSK